MEKREVGQQDKRVMKRDCNAGSGCSSQGRALHLMRYSSGGLAETQLLSYPQRPLTPHRCHSQL